MMSSEMARQVLCMTCSDARVCVCQLFIQLTAYRQSNMICVPMSVPLNMLPIPPQSGVALQSVAVWYSKYE